ncbi:MAG: hypothetical protein SGJ13_13565 [Actinomycetota bacterium]|nr:hypothetical protein [Actinomycetota bacterium]
MDDHYWTGGDGEFEELGVLVEGEVVMSAPAPESRSTESRSSAVEDLDLADVEREICRLPDVSIARIVAEPSGRVSEVHVVAHPGKHPKQIVRDVQSVALASFGLEIDRRVISVVQLGQGLVDTEVAAGPRPSIIAITAEASGLRSLVRVTLARDDDEAVGFAEGSIATTARHRLVAAATVDALRQLEPAAECVDIDHAQIVRVGSHDVAVVTVVFVSPPSEQIVSGSAMVRPQQEADAVARAVLDATNRRLAFLPVT